MRASLAAVGVTLNGVQFSRSPLGFAYGKESAAEAGVDPVTNT